MVFLSTRWCDENLLFYEAVQSYKGMSEASDRQDKAEEIVEFYLKVKQLRASCNHCVFHECH